MPKTTRDDDRVRMLMIHSGWPARTVARLLEVAAEETELAADGILEETPLDQRTEYRRRQNREMGTAVVEPRSDGIAVYAARTTKERRP